MSKLATIPSSSVFREVKNTEIQKARSRVKVWNRVLLAAPGIGMFGILCETVLPIPFIGFPIFTVSLVMLFIASLGLFSSSIKTDRITREIGEGPGKEALGLDAWRKFILSPEDGPSDPQDKYRLWEARHDTSADGRIVRFEVVTRRFVADPGYWLVARYFVSGGLPEPSLGYNGPREFNTDEVSQVEIIERFAELCLSVQEANRERFAKEQVEALAAAHRERLALPLPSYSEVTRGL